MRKKNYEISGNRLMRALSYGDEPLLKEEEIPARFGGLSEESRMAFAGRRSGNSPRPLARPDEAARETQRNVPATTEWTSAPSRL